MTRQRGSTRTSSTSHYKSRGVEMKYGVNLMVWTTRLGREHENLLFRIREWGFDGVERLLVPEGPAEIASVKRMLDSADLERTSCTVLPGEAHLPSPKAEVRARAV